MADRRRVLMAEILMVAVLITTSDVLTAAASNCCSDCIQCPGPHGSCIRRSDLCNTIRSCLNGEDENEAFCKVYVSPSCLHGETQCSSGDCTSWNVACSNTRVQQYYSHGNTPDCSSKLHSSVCQALNASQLPSSSAPLLEPLKPKIGMERVGEYLLASNCSRTNELNTTKCPILYKDVAGTCLAVLPFELSWPAAQKVCQSIAGKLIEFDNLIFFSNIIQHLINTDYVSDFWIGGFFDLEENAWAWSSGGKMPSSTPYWTLKYNSVCQSRQSFNSLGPVPSCFHYQQAPLTFSAGHCAALPYRYLYYISDEPCFENKRPLCVSQISEN